MKRTIASAALLALFAGGAFAQELSTSANVALTSNYKFRGQDQGENKPAIQGGFDLSYGGFYLGNWNSSISWLKGTGSNGLESDLYGGYKGELSPGVGYDVGVLAYLYPGHSDANTVELYGGLSYGLLSAKYSHTVSDEYFGVAESRNTGYFDLSANYPVMPKLTLNAHVGYTRFTSDAKDANAGALKNYTDYKLGATYDLGQGFSLAGAVVGADQRGTYGDINKARFVVTLSKAL